MASLVRTGVKIPGRDMVDRRARPRDPLRKTFCLPLTRSLATQANRVGSRNLIENQRNLLAGVQACGKLKAFVDSKFEGAGIVVDVLLAPEREVLKWGIG